MLNNRLIEIYKVIHEKRANDFNSVILDFLVKEDLFFKIYNTKEITEEELLKLNKLGKDLNKEKEALEVYTDLVFKNIPSLKDRIYMISTFFIVELMDINDNIKKYIEKQDALYINTLTPSNIFRLGCEKVFNDTYDRAKLIETINILYGDEGVYKYLLINKKLKRTCNHDLFHLIGNNDFSYGELLNLLSGESGVLKESTSVVAQKILSKQLRYDKTDRIEL